MRARLTEERLSAPPSLDFTSSRPKRRAPRVGLRGGRYRSYSLAERLAARTIIGPSCWEIQGKLNGPNGYGQIALGRIDGRLRFACTHRVAWELAFGPIPDGLRVLHNCPGGDNPRCVNPAHLYLGTQQDNMRDSVEKGRHSAWRQTGVRLNGQPAKQRAATNHTSAGPVHRPSEVEGAKGRGPMRDGTDLGLRDGRI